MTDELVRGISPYPAQIETPLTGVTVTMTRNWLTIIPAATIAALTVELPAAPADGEVAGINMTQIITTLTVQATGKTVASPLAAGTVGGFAAWKYRLSNTTWYRVG